MRTYDASVGRLPGASSAHLDELDVITLTGVRVHGLHGVFSEEKRDGHEFIVDLHAYADLGSAGRDDSLERSVSYAELADIIEAVVGGPSVDLIETLAERIAARIVGQYPLIRRIDVRVHKPSAPITQPFSDVSVTVKRVAPEVLSVLSLGSNMGDSSEILEAALTQIRAIPATRVLGASPVYHTEPWGPIQQAPFLNASILLATELSPWQLFCHTAQIEQWAGRERTTRWGPRTLDIDIVTWADLTLDDPALQLPHPRARERQFVLVPTADLVPIAQASGIVAGARLLQSLSQGATGEAVSAGPSIPGFGKTPGQAAV